MTEQPILKVRNLRFSYGHRDVHKDINIEVREREVVGVVGPNGAGKTTLLRLISGSLKPQQGTVEILSKNTFSLRPKERAKLIAVVPQNPAIPVGFTAMEAVLMGRNPHIGLFGWERKHDLDMCCKAMTLTNTLNLSHRLVTTLSGGELQRVLIARALSQQAPLLLLDEPTANLDISHQGEVMNTISSLQKNLGGAALVAMHDLNLAAQYCNRIVMLSNGTVFTEGSPWQVLTPENINSVYGVKVTLTSHPSTSTPVVLPHGKNGLEQN